MTKKFFVYGTLKVGGRFASRFDAVRENSVAATLHGYDLYSIGEKSSAYFPGIVPGSGMVTGEVHTYDEAIMDDVLKAMDMIEGYRENNEKGSLYIRRKLPITLDDGSETEAYVYLFNHKIAPYYCKIESGIWEI